MKINKMDRNEFVECQKGQRGADHHIPSNYLKDKIAV